MKVIRKEEAEVGKNSELCKTIEYSFGDKDIDLGIATITGRYPSVGYALNTISKELVYVLEGEGTLCFEDKKVDFSEVDAILIDINDKYYYDTKYAVVSMSCTPAWSVQQHKIVNE